MKYRSTKGFTITELMIATTVFSVILLVGAAAFIQLGRSYYKGVTITQTQQVAKQIMNSISSNIGLSTSVSPNPNTTKGYYCIGSHRYTYNIKQPVNLSSHNNTSNFGLMVDEPTGSGCGDPFATPGVPISSTAVEMLGNNMRLWNFSIDPVSNYASNSVVYKVKFTLIFGQDSVIASDGTCKGQLNDTQFCSVTTVSRIVYQGASI